MTSLFVGGVMNIFFIAPLTELAAIEKLAPKGEWAAQIVGAVMIGGRILRIMWPVLSRHP